MDPVTATQAVSLGFAALEMAAIMYEHAKRKGASQEQLAAYRAKALELAGLTRQDMQAAQGPEEGSGAAD
jgi:hypothetical protein